MPQQQHVSATAYRTAPTSMYQCGGNAHLSGALNPQVGANLSRRLNGGGGFLLGMLYRNGNRWTFFIFKRHVLCLSCNHKHICHNVAQSRGLGARFGSCPKKSSLLELRILL